MFVPADTATPPVIVILPSATDTRPATLTARPLPTLAPTRTPPPSATLRPGQPTAPPRPSATPRPATGSGARSRQDPPPTRTPKETSTPKPPPASKTPPPPTQDNSLIAQLRRGGLVVYMRHMRTDWEQDSREREWVAEMLFDRSLFGQCDRQRLLTDAGRDDARRIGAAISRLGIPVGEVLTSEWCRTRETASLVFGRGEPAPDRLFDTGYLDAGSGERQAYTEALRALISSPVGEGANRVLVGHGPQIYDAARVILQEGDAVVIRPEGGGYKVVRTIPPGGWDSLGN